MRVAIIGAGALGSLFGGILSQEDHEVWLYNPSNIEHIDVIERSGLRIETPEGNLKVYPLATSSIKKIPKNIDLVGIFVKAYDTEAAMRDAAQLIKEKTWVLTLQNGIGPEEMILKQLKKGTLLRGVTSQGATYVSPGIVRWGGLGPTGIAGIPKLSPKRYGELEKICKLFSQANWESTPERDIDHLLWEKLLVNVGINPLTALFDVPNGKLLEDKRLNAIMRELVAEAYPVAQKKGLKCSLEKVQHVVNSVCEQTATNISSMLQDVRRGKRTEIEYISGAVAQEAERMNLSAPLNQLVMALLMKR